MAEIGRRQEFYRRDARSTTVGETGIAGRTGVSPVQGVGRIGVSPVQGVGRIGVSPVHSSSYGIYR